MRKPTVWISDQVRYKPDCASKENSKTLEEEGLYYLCGENKGADAAHLTCPFGSI